MFHIHTKNDLVYLTSDVLENNAIVHGFSTRKGGVSPTPWDSLNLDDRRGDDLANVQENFRRLCTALDTDVQRAVLSRQVHRSDVRRVTAVDCGKGLWRPQDYDSADALVTDVPGIPLIVFSADCNVLLLHDPVRRVIGAAHAGWRAIRALQRRQYASWPRITDATRRTSVPPSDRPSDRAASRRMATYRRPCGPLWAMRRSRSWHGTAASGTST